ncbi:hypothetical protein BDF22DRAFT_688320 [Syncephalis plumigaleata]|nr:hypothetical protein BDF22DRAFT_688320 [Syncephalis plumigaleata]
MTSTSAVACVNRSVNVERDRHTVIWQATIRVNPSLLLPLSIEAETLDVCLGELAELTGVVLWRELPVYVDQLEPTPTIMNLAAICQTSSIPSIYRTGIYCDVVTMPDANAATRLFNKVLDQINPQGYSQYAMILHVTSQARLCWTTNNKWRLIRKTTSNYITACSTSICNQDDNNDGNNDEASLCIKAEWMYNYDEFVNLYNYDDQSSNTRTSDSLSSLSSSHSIHVASTRKDRKSNDTSVLIAGNLAEHLYLEHVSAQIDSEAANATKTPASIRKRLTKRDRTIMQRLTDTNGKSSSTTKKSTGVPKRTLSMSSDTASPVIRSAAMKKVVLLELRTIGIDRHHASFNKYWSILYPGVKLALEEIVCKRLLTTEELRKNVEEHLRLLQKYVDNKATNKS